MFAVGLLQTPTPLQHRWRSWQKIRRNMFAEDVAANPSTPIALLKELAKHGEERGSHACC